MKTLCTMLILAAAIIVSRAQTTSPGDSMEAQIHQRLQQRPADQALIGVRPQRPNEVQLNGVTYSGITIQLARTDNPLQLINPAAPPQYGSSEDNTVRDPITGRASGLKLFSIQF
jgi:hypothetical protein